MNLTTQITESIFSNQIESLDYENLEGEFNPYRIAGMGLTAMSSLAMYYGHKYLSNPENLIEAVRTRSYLKTKIFYINGINVKNSNGSTALMIAAQKGQTEIVKELLKAPGIDVNIRNNNGETALMLATHSHNAEIINALLKMPNIEVNLVDNNGYTALVSAIETRLPRVLEPILRARNTQVNSYDNNGDTGLIRAIKYICGEEIIQCILASPNVNVNLVDNSGYTALMWAIIKGQTENIRAILDNPDVDLQCTTNKGQTALTLARSNPKIAKVIRDSLEARKSSVRIALNFCLIHSLFLLVSEYM